MARIVRVNPSCLLVSVFELSLFMCKNVIHQKVFHFFQAAQNLVVLSRDEGGAEQIFRNDGVKLIQKLLPSKQEDVVLSALRTLVGLCTGHQSRVRII